MLFLALTRSNLAVQHNPQHSLLVAQIVSYQSINIPIYTLFLFAIDAIKRPHTASVVIAVGETATFDVIYKPTTPQRSQGHLRLSVINNQYEDSVVQLVGEGYIDDITLDKINSIFVPQPVSDDSDGNNADDDVEGNVHYLHQK